MEGNDEQGRIVYMFSVVYSIEDLLISLYMASSSHTWLLYRI